MFQRSLVTKWLDGARTDTRLKDVGRIYGAAVLGVDVLLVLGRGRIVGGVTYLTFSPETHK